MGRLVRVGAVAIIMLTLAGAAAARQKTDGQNSSEQLIPLKVEFVVSEFDGTKKISSLPYTLDVSAAASKGAHLNYSRLRMGVRVPVLVGDGSKGNQWQYVDVGTNIDCWATAIGDGAFKIGFDIDRSSTYTPQAAATEVEPSLKYLTSQPILRQLKASTTLVLRDGQSDNSTLASDPFNGHMMRIAVTLHVVKAP